MWNLDLASAHGVDQEVVLGAFSVPSYVLIKGIEITLSVAGLGSEVTGGYERADETNPARFRATNCTGSFGAPCCSGHVCTQADCVQADASVTTGASAQMRLQSPDGYSSYKFVPGNGVVVLGGPTDLWGWGAGTVQPDDVNTVAFKGFLKFDFTESQSTTIIKQQGTGTPTLPPTRSPSITVTNVRIYYESYGTLWYADLDANGALTGITLLKDGTRVNDYYNGRFMTGGNVKVTWADEGFPVTQVLTKERIGGVWGGESTHAVDPLSWDDQVIGPTVTTASEYNGSLKEDLSYYNALKKTTGFTFVWRSTKTGAVVDYAFNIKTDTTVEVPPDAAAVNMDGHGLAALQAGGEILGAVVTDDNTDFDVWLLYRTSD